MSKKNGLEVSLSAGKSPATESTPLVPKVVRYSKISMGFKKKTLTLYYTQTFFRSNCFDEYFIKYAMLCDYIKMFRDTYIFR